MSRRKRKTCYKVDIAPQEKEQNCAMWDFDYFGQSNVYIRSIYFRGAINVITPILAFGAFSSIIKSSALEGMRGNFLGSTSLQSLRFLTPIVLFKTSAIHSFNDYMYYTFGEDHIFRLAKDVNAIIENACSIEFILNWLGRCCIPYPKESKEDEDIIQKEVSDQYENTPDIVGDILDGATKTAGIIKDANDEFVDTVEETIEDIRGIAGEDSKKEEL